MIPAMNFKLPELPQLDVSFDATTASCFRTLAVEEHVSLLPSYTGRVGEGVVQHLNRRVLRYSEDYKGVLLAYSRPTVLQSVGRIFDDQPHVHFSVKYDACIFKPTVGSILVGTVNKIGGDHVGCVVYNCFNASIDDGREDRRTVMNFSNGFFHQRLELGENVWFRVTNLDAVGGMLSIKGEYVDMDSIGIESSSASMQQAETELIRDEKVLPHRKKMKKRRSQGTMVEGEEEGEGEGYESGKRKRRQEQEVDSVTKESVMDSGREGGPPVSRKRKKRKRVSESEDGESLSLPATKDKHVSAPRATRSTPKKKLKLNTDGDEVPSGLVAQANRHRHSFT